MVRRTRKEGEAPSEPNHFYWRLGKLAKARGRHLQYLKDVRVVPSARRFDQWPSWRILIETNPFYITRFRRDQNAWRGWYKDVPR